MADCQEYGKGDLVSWDRSHFKISKATVHEGHDLKALCKTQQQFVIFPEKKRFLEAKSICEIHGGKLAVPKSDIDHQNIMELLETFQCAEDTQDATKKMAWLGASKIDGKWYEICRREWALKYFASTTIYY